MADAGYRVAPIILIRMAGVPFDALTALATSGTAKAARACVVKEAEVSRTHSAVEDLLASGKHDLTKEQSRIWRKALRTGEMPASADPSSSPYAELWQSANDLAVAKQRLDEVLLRELEHARGALQLSAQKFLPSYLIFAGEGMNERLTERIEQSSATGIKLPPRNARQRDRERRFLLYLQRVCAKNDTFSEFGPQGWGSISQGNRALDFAPVPGIARRETFLERWTAHGVAAAINADSEAWPELPPRLHPNLRIDGKEIIFAETGEREILGRDALTLLAACDGVAPAHSLGVDLETLIGLAERGFILWQIEVRALDPHAFDVLVSDVSAWRDGPARTRWLERLHPLATLPMKFGATTDTSERIALINEASARLEALGVQKTASRFLYSATNPIAEECFRECRFRIGEDLIEQVAHDARPWIDLWRDTYAFAASRVAAGLRGLLERAPLQDGSLPLPAFMRHCAEAKLPLTGPGMVAFAAMAFHEVKAVFRETFASRSEMPECTLTAEDCQFVRRNFEFDKFDAYTYPSADLQLSAASIGAVERGDFEWILAELHPPLALLHHAFYWSCPEKAVLSQALATAACDRPNFHFGFFAADFTAATAVRLFDALPELSYFVAPQRSHPHWKTVAPAEVEVFVDEGNNDVGLRRRGSHEYLGSFARAWLIPLGFHPFSFSLGRHTPRFRCGKVIVQRRAWTVALEELGGGDFTGVSRHLVLAVERLRAARDLPRHIYIRPTEAALRRSGAEGRDKDTKPVYVDLESYLFLEIFHRWLVKAGELEVTEMLPDPDHLLWQEKDGRRTFELRTQIVPR